MTTSSFTAKFTSSGFFLLFAIATAMSFTLGGHAAVAAENWPFARGTTASTGVAKSAIPQQPELIWKYEVGEAAIEATVVVYDSVAYFGDTEGTVHAIDIVSGEPKWTKKIEDSGFIAAGAVDAKNFWVGDFVGEMRCLSTSDGAIAWQKTLPAEVMAGPIVHNGQLLVTTEAGSFTAFDAKSGEQLWEYTIDAPLRCTPTIYDGKAMLAGCDGKLHAYDLEKQKETDSVEIDGPTGSTPASSRGKLYFGTEQGTFFAIDAGNGPLEIAWQYADRRRRQGIRTAAAVNDKLAVFGSQGRAVFAVNLTTGDQAWKYVTRSRVESSPTIAGKVAVVATQRGKLLTIDLASGEDVWQFDAGGGFIASPVVVDGRLIIGNTDGTLYCFGKKEPQSTEEKSSGN